MPEHLMNSHRFFLSLLILVFCVSTSNGLALPAEWKYSQSFTLGQTGLVKIAVPLDTLTSSRVGWPDLRVTDSTGNTIPFAFERPSQALSFQEPASTFQSRIENEATIIRISTIRTETPIALELETAETEFIKAALLEASADGRTWQLIARGVPLFLRATGQRQLRMPLPAGKWNQFRVTIDDRRSNPIPFTGARLHFGPSEKVASEPLSVGITERIEEPGRTRLKLRLGGSNLTLDSITFDTPEPIFSRAVSITKMRVVGDEARETIVASDVVYSLGQGNTNVNPKRFVARGLSLDSQELSLIIDNLDNSPLGLDGITARYRTVFLVFNAPVSGTYDLLSGNPDCVAPTYDLAHLEKSFQTIPLVQTQPGGLKQNPAYQRANRFAMIDPIGAPLDTDPWLYRKTIPVSNEEVHQVELDLDVMSHSKRGLEDLRLMQEGRQIPYILDRTTIMRSLVPSIVAAQDPKRPKVSRWKLSFPHPDVWYSSLTVTSSTPYFRREVRVVASRKDAYGNPSQETLGSTVWARLPEDTSTLFTLPLGSITETNIMFLEIENGDNPALELSSFRLWWSTSRLVFKPKAAVPLALYYGNPKVGSPRYDLDLLGSRLILADKTPTLLATEETLQPRSMFGALDSAGWIFWAVLALVVAGLLFVIARLVPKPVT